MHLLRHAAAFGLLCRKVTHLLLLLLQLLLLHLPHSTGLVSETFRKVLVCPVQHQLLHKTSTKFECVQRCLQDFSCFAAHHSDTSCTLASVNEFFSPRWQSQPNSPAACSSFVKSTAADRQRVIDQLFHVFYDFREGFDNKVSVGAFVNLSATGVGVSTSAEGAELRNDTLNSFVEIRNASELMDEAVPSVGGWGQFANFSVFFKLRGQRLPGSPTFMLFVCKCSDKYDYEMYIMDARGSSEEMASLSVFYLDGGSWTKLGPSAINEQSSRIDADWSSYLVSFNSSRSSSQLQDWAAFHSGFVEMPKAAVNRDASKTYLTANSRSCLRIGYHNGDLAKKFGGTVRCFGIGRPDVQLQDIRPLQLLC